MKKALFVFASVAVISACAAQDGSKAPAVSEAVPPKASPLGSASYLGSTALPESLELVPAPPAAGSAAEARDEAGAANALTLRGSARWDIAKGDAELSPAAVASRFSCAAGVSIGKQETPALYKVIATAEPDLGIATSDVKKHYMRPRPFMKNGQPTCTPDWEAVLRRDGSYPSGHSSIGYGVGLILAEIIPDRAARLVSRGRAFGDSRRICNVHWLSDIEEGRVVASATVMRLNADPAFAVDIAAARSEIERLRASGAGIMPDCNSERTALAL